ncbi:hypothetical protein IFM89_017782 [Coptis chinensis]|uniref:Uncharacterized protein n=1 Tax=Coptis chinensis TaxID=261450 RepID=A0A835I5N5_9MAGN|nr:hypothetical protein IFM89_017782 [Coptis chinensis]
MDWLLMRRSKKRIGKKRMAVAQKLIQKHIGRKWKVVRCMEVEGCGIKKDEGDDMTKEAYEMAKKHKVIIITLVIDDITFIDPLNTFTGMEKYKLIFWALCFHGRILFEIFPLRSSGIWRTVRENVILIGWNLRGVPRVHWEAKGQFQAHCASYLFQEFHADDVYEDFRKIVPLNAGNVLGSEDNAPARKWMGLIRKTLNNLPGASGGGGYQTPSPVLDPVCELDADFEGSTSSITTPPSRGFCTANLTLINSLRGLESKFGQKAMPIAKFQICSVELKISVLLARKPFTQLKKVFILVWTWKMEASWHRETQLKISQYNLSSHPP